MRYQRFFVGLLILSLLSGCASVRGYTRKDKQNHVLSMRELALNELYDLKPEAQFEIEKASGYAVFSNVNSHLFLLSSGTGYGVVVNQETGENTYMKMFSLGGGLGLGAKDYRAVLIFNNIDDLNAFAKGQWSFSGDIDAAAKSAEKGGSLSGTRPFTKDIIIYHITEAGLILHATLQGTKYYRYHELN